MEIKKGTIRTVTESTGVGKNGEWKRFAFEMTDGKKYSTFDKKIGEVFGAGMNVVMTGEQDGQYWKMADMKMDNLPAASQVEKAMHEDNPNKLMSVKDRMIVAQCLTKVVYSGVDITPESVLATYRYFIDEL